MVFANGVKDIKAAAYNGARTVYDYLSVMEESKCDRKGSDVFSFPLKLTLTSYFLDVIFLF